MEVVSMLSVLIVITRSAMSAWNLGFRDMKISMGCRDRVLMFGEALLSGSAASQNRNPETRKNKHHDFILFYIFPSPPFIISFYMKFI